MSVKDDKPLTKNQQLVYNALRKARVPLSAYELLDQLRKHGFRAPPQVYRAVEKLIELGLIHRLESINAFVACDQPEQSYCSSAFAICDRCSSVIEIPAAKLKKELQSMVEDQSFLPVSSAVEVHGTCSDCADVT